LKTTSSNSRRARGELAILRGVARANPVNTVEEFAIVAVSAYVRSGDRVLLVQRGKEPGKGLWAFPGGRVRRGEKLAEAVKRELREETNIEGEPVGIVAVTEVIARARDGRPYHYVILTFAIREETIRGTLRPGGDVLEARWIPVQEALEMRTVVGSVKRVLESPNLPIINPATLE